LSEGLVVVAALPNLLSLLRIALVPVLVYFLADTGPSSSALAALTFFVASLTDFLDGYLARRHGQTTTLGKFLDPLADKLIVVSALIMLAATDRFPRVPAWMVVVIVGRELAVTGLRGIASGEGIILAAEELGKYKMILQILALHGLLLHYRYVFVDCYFSGLVAAICPVSLLHYRYVFVDCHAAGMYFLWISLVMSLWSGIDYHIKVARQVLVKRSSSVPRVSLSAEGAGAQS
jgi:CDP-diacylglycerol--glycerol-3-phosphate 3-phosphatidyltransferase